LPKKRKVHYLSPSVIGKDVEKGAMKPLHSVIDETLSR
jgi:hypothetical protein